MLQRGRPKNNISHRAYSLFIPPSPLPPPSPSLSLVSGRFFLPGNWRVLDRFSLSPSKDHGPPSFHSNAPCLRRRTEKERRLVPFAPCAKFNLTKCERAFSKIRVSLAGRATRTAPGAASGAARTLGESQRRRRVLKEQQGEKEETKSTGGRKICDIGVCW